MERVRNTEGEGEGWQGERQAELGNQEVTRRREEERVSEQR